MYDQAYDYQVKLLVVVFADECQKAHRFFIFSTFLALVNMVDAMQQLGLGWVGGGVMLTFLALVNMVDATQQLGWGWEGWGDVKFLHIERKIASVVHSQPPSHYITCLCPQHEH